MVLDNGGALQMTIQIGLAGWGDHDSLYSSSARAGDKLSHYAKHFSVVEIDSTFYAIQSPERIKKWISDTPDHFKFVVKAYQGMTGHQRHQQTTEDKRKAMYDAFIAMLQPLIEANRLLFVLFQYPPWFDCMTKHVMVLRSTKSKMGEIPCAIEFRNQTWYAESYKERTLKFLQDEKWIHSICDEPQAGEGSIPVVEEVTSTEYTLIRFHGRNVDGWNDSGHENWREVRYLYDYSLDELTEWKLRLDRLQQHCNNLIVIFNNNSGGHAAHNAKQLMTLYEQIRPDGKQPLEPVTVQAEQLSLF